MKWEVLIQNRDVQGIKQYCAEHNLVLVGNKLVPRDEGTKTQLLAQARFWNQRQQAR